MRWTSLALALLQYQSIAGPLAVPDPASETQASDRWVARYPDAVRRPTTHASRVPSVVAPVFVPTTADNPQTPDRWGPKYPDLTPRRALRTALQRIFTNPVVVPAAADAPQTVDRWQGRYPDSTRRTRLPEAVRASGASPLFVIDVTNPVIALSWQSEFADRTPREPSVVGPPAHAWHPATPAAGPTNAFPSADPGGGDIPIGSVVVQYAAITGPVSGVATPLQFDVRWTNRYPDRVERRPVRPFGGSVAPLFVPDLTNPVTARAWAPSYPDLTRTVRRRPQADQPYSVLPVLVPDWEVANLSWSRPQADTPVRPRPRVYLAVSSAWQVETPVLGVFDEQIPIECAPPPRAVEIHASRIPFYAASLEIPVAVSTGIIWAPTYPSSVPRPIRRAYQERPQPMFGVQVQVPVMSWTGNALGTIRPLLRRAIPLQPQPIPFVPDVTTQAPSLSWQPEYPDSARPARPRLAGHVAWPPFVADVTDAPPPLSWQAELPDWPPRAPAFAESLAYASLGYLPDVTLVAPVLSWRGTWADRVDRPTTYASRQQALAWPPFVVGVTVATPDVLAPPDATPRPAARVAWLLAHAWEPATITVEAVVTDLSWSPRYADAVPAARRTADGWIAFAQDLDVAPERSWAGSYPDFAPSYAPRPRPQGDPQPFVPDVTEPAPPLAWAPSAPDWLARTATLPVGALPTGAEWPSYIPDVTVVAPDLAWLGAYPDAARGFAPTARPAAVAPVYIPGVTDPVVGIAWVGSYPDRVPGVSLPASAQQATAWPPFVVDVTNPVEILAWQGRYADRVDPLRGLASAAQQAFAWFPEDATIVVAAPDLRLPALVDFVPRVGFPTQTQQAYAAPDLVPDVTQPVGGVEWIPAYPDWLPPVRPVLGFTPDVGWPPFVPDATEPVPDRAWAPFFPDALAPPLGLAPWLQQPHAWFPEPIATVAATAMIEIDVPADDRTIVVAADDREIDVETPP